MEYIHPVYELYHPICTLKVPPLKICVVQKEGDHKLCDVLFYEHGSLECTISKDFFYQNVSEINERVQQALEMEPDYVITDAHSELMDNRVIYITPPSRTLPGKCTGWFPGIGLYSNLEGVLSFWDRIYSDIANRMSIYS